MLNDKQALAISMIVAGSRYKEVEEALDVSHAQLWRWRQAPEFGAALEQERAKLHERRRDKLWAVHERAMDVVLRSLDEGDPKMAIDVFRIGVPGLTDTKSNESAPIVTRDKEGARLSVAPSETEHVCETCSKVCATAGGLARHARTHAA